MNDRFQRFFLFAEILGAFWIVPDGRIF